MSKSRTFASVMLVIMLLVVGTSTALAGPPTNTHVVVDEKAPTWTIDPSICLAVKVPVTGSGQRHKVTNTRVNPDGSTVITINDLVKGNASDSTGGTYNFVYENHSVEQVPAGGGAHQISMEDNFILNGKGSVGHLAVGFNWRWTYTPPGQEMWPPVDNWQQLSTRGDPLHCDPL